MVSYVDSIRLQHGSAREPRLVLILCRDLGALVQSPQVPEASCGHYQAGRRGALAERV
jgi:hypothetical protein